MASIDPQTLGLLYRQHGPALRLFARQWGHRAEDLVQDAFVQLAQQAKPPEKVLPWLYRVIRNQAYADNRTIIRRRKREEKVSTPEGWFDSVDEQLDAREATRMLAELPLELREVIVARLWGGLTFDDVAQVVGCSLPTAHRRYQTGLAALKERLEGKWTRPHPIPAS